MRIFGPRCPVPDQEREWIEDRMGWLRGEFGDEPLSAPVILPTRDFFPPPSPATDDDIRAVVAKVAGYMGVQPRVSVRFSEELDRAEGLRGFARGAMHTSGAAGVYTHARPGAAADLTLDRSVTRQPLRLLAVVAHELAHVRLLSEDRTDPGRPDGEPLTDLATVYLGMGIFTANASFDFSQHADGKTFSWQARRLGYLTEQMFGYALARLAVMRGERRPEWGRHLDTNPRAYLSQAARYLAGTGSG